VLARSAPLSVRGRRERGVRVPARWRGGVACRVPLNRRPHGRSASCLRPPRPRGARTREERRQGQPTCVTSVALAARAMIAPRGAPRAVHPARRGGAAGPSVASHLQIDKNYLELF
jgi:hypothetical protein